MRPRERENEGERDWDWERHPKIYPAWSIRCHRNYKSNREHLVVFKPNSLLEWWCCCEFASGIIKLLGLQKPTKNTALTFSGCWCLNSKMHVPNIYIYIHAFLLWWKAGEQVQKLVWRSGYDDRTTAGQGGSSRITSKLKGPFHCGYFDMTQQENGKTHRSEWQTMDIGWIPLSCLSLRVLGSCMLAPQDTHSL